MNFDSIKQKFNAGRSSQYIYMNLEYLNAITFLMEGMNIPHPHSPFPRRNVETLTLPNSFHVGHTDITVFVENISYVPSSILMLSSYSPWKLTSLFASLPSLSKSVLSNKGEHYQKNRIALSIYSLYIHVHFEFLYSRSANSSKMDKHMKLSRKQRFSGITHVKQACIFTEIISSNI